jgi:HEPN domain-containing protein
MDSKEANAYFETAEDQLKGAEVTFKEGSYALCTFLSASSAENATSALLITLGAKPSKKHRNSLVLHKLAQRVTSEMRSSIMEIVESMKTLEPHITKARYPILKGWELLPPSRFYTKEIAEEALTKTRKVVEKVNQLIECHKTAR